MDEVVGDREESRLEPQVHSLNVGVGREGCCHWAWEPRLDQGGGGGAKGR